MTLKTKIQIADAIAERMNEIKPGQYFALPENEMVKIMGRNEEGKIVMYIDPESICTLIAKELLTQVSTL